MEDPPKSPLKRAGPFRSQLKIAGGDGVMG
jgi:hypothetical protein